MREIAIELLFPDALLFGFDTNEYEEDEHIFNDFRIMLGFFCICFTSIERA